MAIVTVGMLLPPGLVHAVTPVDSGKRAVEQATELWKSGDADAAIAFLQKATESGASA